MAISKNDLIASIRQDLGLSEHEEPKVLQESYVTQAKSYNLNTELLSPKSKRAHQELFEKYVDDLNEVSAKLDTVSRDDANLNASEFRSLKIDEVYNLNASFLHAMFFENISDLQSTIAMDTLPFLRLERDFGSFDAWQKDFIACALSARNGWAVTVYNSYLNRYMNVAVDLHSQNVPFSSYPVIVVDCWEHTYYRDYLSDRKSYVYGMMKELNWDAIEARFKKAEKIAKVMAG
jgi:Fe-Mn family superoxide dismutase